MQNSKGVWRYGLVFSVLFLLALIHSALAPSMAAAEFVTPDGYKHNDYQKLVAFLEQTNRAQNNGKILNPDYDPTDPTTWTGVAWTGSPKEVLMLSWSQKWIVGSLDVSECTSLVQIYCSANSITELNVSGCTALRNIYGRENELTSLDVSSCSSLATLECQNNKLVDLKLGTHPNLSTLKCENNQLTFATLPAPQGTIMTYTYAPQSDIQIGTDSEVYVGERIDISSMLQGAGYGTEFNWYRANNAKITPSSADQGVFIFDQSFHGSQVYCELTNSHFPGLSLTTQIVAVSGLVTLTSQPQDCLVTSGSTASFSVGVAPMRHSDLSYRWQRSSDNGNWSDIPGANGDTYTNSGAIYSEHGTQYRCIVGNELNGYEWIPAISEPATLSVLADAVIEDEGQPKDVAVKIGDNATFTVVAVVDDQEGGQLLYQWERSIDGGSWTTVEGQGAKEASYTVPNVSYAQTGHRYRCQVRHTKEGITSQPVISKEAFLRVVAHPTITEQPQGTTVATGQMAVFGVTATAEGGGTLAYQWEKSTDGLKWYPIEGAVLSSYLTPKVSEDNHGERYRCQVKNTNFGVDSAIETSDVVTLTVVTKPRITAHPQDRMVPRGRSVTFEVEANVEDGGTLSFQWMRHIEGSWTPISGETDPGYTISAVESEADGAMYACQVTNTKNGVSSDYAQSNLATLTVLNDHDYGKLRAFLESDGGTGIKNGTRVNSGYDAEDPKTWGNCYWESSKEGQRVRSITWAYKGLVGQLDLSSLSHLTTLWVDNNALSSIDVSNCVGLSTLGCWSNEIVSLDLTGCHSLTTLYCNDNELATLELSGLENLVELDCRKNRLQSLDLSDSPNMTRISCSKNELTTLDLRAQSSLSWLDCADNNLTSLLVNLDSLTGLLYLDCTNNNLTFATLPQVSGTSYILFPQKPMSFSVSGYVYVGDIVDLLAQAGLNTEFSWFTSDHKPIELFSPSAGTFVIDHEHGGRSIFCKMTNPEFGDGWIALESEVVHVCQGVVLTSQPENMAVIRGDSAEFSITATTDDDGVLSYQWQKLSEGDTWSDISGETSASYRVPSSQGENVGKYRCQVTSNKNGVGVNTAYSNSATLTVYNDSDYAKLRAFLESDGGTGIKNGTRVNLDYDAEDPKTWGDCYWEPSEEGDRALVINWANKGLVGDLDLSGLNRLEDLYINNGFLSSVNLRNCEKLTAFHCWDNEISSVNLSGCISLKTLLCHDNKLTTIDLSGLASLENLDCSGNLLTSLDASGNTALKVIACSNNKLQELLVELAQLERLLCERNNLTFATLPRFDSPLSDGYVYSPQSPIRLAIDDKILVGEEIDLSSQATRDGVATTFTWYGLQGNPIQRGDGIFVLRPSDAQKTVYCEMSNPLFPDLLLRTKDNSVHLGLVIDTQPKDVRVRIDQSASFSLDASTDDGGEIIYQWEKSNDGKVWIELANATKSSYTVSSITGDSHGDLYRCKVTNTRNGATIVSDTATLLVRTHGVRFIKPLEGDEVDINSGSLVMAIVDGDLQEIKGGTIQVDDNPRENVVPATALYYLLPANLKDGEHTITIRLVTNAEPEEATVTFVWENYRRGFGFGRFDFGDQ